MLEKNGIYFPKAGRREKDMLRGAISPGNADEVRRFMEDGAWDKVKFQLNTWIDEAKERGCNRLLLTNEVLIRTFSKTEIITQFLGHCQAAKITNINFMLVLRNPVEQALSLYKHRSKSGTTAFIEEWVKTGYILPENIQAFLCFSESRQLAVQLRKYQKDSRHLSKIFFQDWLNIPVPTFDESEKVNPSLTLSELLILKQIRKWMPLMVKPFYDAMLAIPMHDKVDDLYLKKYHVMAISNHLVPYADIWRLADKLLPEGEKLKFPQQCEAIGPQENVVSLSSRQIEVWLGLQKQFHNPVFVWRSWVLYRLKPLLAAIKKNVHKAL